MSFPASPRSLVPAILLLALVAGCGQNEPKVATDIPQVRAAATPDLSTGKLPKGMPKNTTANLKLDPSTGRPVEQ